jgi:predicted deacylase
VPAHGPFRLGGEEVAPGTRRRVRLEVAKPYGQAQVDMSVAVLHGVRPGPRLFVAAAIHGDEILGVEIIRRLLRVPLIKRLRGTLVAVPIVNVYGFLTQSRYLPDRRDLNRSFPGSPTGSLTARLAHVFMTEIVERCTHGIDLHTAAAHRQNLPYMRAVMDHPETARLARRFGAPVILNAGLLEGSLRAAAVARGMPLLVYEACEPHRFDEMAIRVGVRGILNTMRGLGMLPDAPPPTRAASRPLHARNSQWVRAPDSGVLRTAVKLGAAVRRGTVLGIISDPIGDHEIRVEAPAGGIVIARTGLPLVNGGDALFHIATFARPRAAAAAIDALHGELAVDSPSGEPPIR